MASKQHKKLPSTAVCLATYNGIDWLPALIHSVLAQQGTEICIFARDDGSDDGTRNVLEGFASSYSDNFKLIESVCQSGSPGANFFKILETINLSNFDYLAFCDQDDIWDCNKLGRAISVLSTGRYRAYSSNLTVFSDRGDLYSLVKSQPKKEYDFYFQTASAGCTYVLSVTVAKELQKAIRKLGLNTGELSHDGLTYAYVRSSGAEWYYDHQSHIFHRQHRANNWGALRGFDGLQLKFRHLKRGFYFAHIQTALRSFPSKNSHKILGAFERLNFFDLLFLLSRSFQFRRRLIDVFFLQIVLFLRWLKLL